MNLARPPAERQDVERFVVGVHFTRHRGGPGSVTVDRGVLTLADRKGTRTVRHTDPRLHCERKRFEPFWGNHWISLTDGEVTAHAVVSRRRADRILQAAAANGFTVERTA